jgi:hypothetical protein
MGLFGSFLGGSTKPKTPAFNKYKRVGKLNFEKKLKEGLKYADREEIKKVQGEDYFRGGQQRSYKQIEDDLKKGKIKKSVLDRFKKATEKSYAPKTTGPTEEKIRKKIAASKEMARQIDDRRQNKGALSRIGEDSSRLGVAGERYKSGGIASREVSTQDLRGEGKNKNVSIGQKSASVSGGLSIANKPSSAKPDNVIKGNFGNKGVSRGVPPIGIKKARNF